MNRTMVSMYLEDATETSIKGLEDRIMISLGDNLVFVSKELAEKLFTQLDAIIHEPTVTHEYLTNEVSEKEDIIFTLQEELDEAKQTLEMMQDNMKEAI